MGIGIQGLGSYIEAGAGGGGITIIPDGGELAGTYAGSVFCGGNASMTDDVFIAGDLFQNYSSGGSITNTGRYDLRVNGSAHIYQYDNNPADSTQQNGDVLIDGNFSFAYCYAYSSGGTNSQFRIGGDCVGNVGFSGAVLVLNGLDDTFATDAIIYGDLMVGYLEGNGGDSVASNAGRGSNINVYGDMACQFQVTIDGGDANSTGFNAGGGGDLYVYGNLTVYYDIRARGGAGTDGNGGQGGEVLVRGNLVADDVRLNGGSCSSDNDVFSAGVGGYFYVQGNVVVRTIRTYGGNRFGNLSAGPSATPANGGNVQIFGACTGIYIEAFGGGMFTNNFAACDGGYGGSVYIRGNVTMIDDDAGDGYIDTSGGQGGSFGGGGFAGQILTDGSLRTYNTYQAGGDAGNSGNAGNGGYLAVHGDAFISYITTEGGNAGGGNAGNAGNIDIYGKLTTNSGIYATGGGCTSTDQSHRSGRGGDITCLELVATSDIYTNGGDRSGATPFATSLAPPRGGNLSVNGPATIYYMETSGGSISTDYSVGNGGNGGDVYIDGNCVVESDVFLEGGNNIGPDGGGKGGDFIVIGSTTIAGSLYLSGGNSNNSSAGGDAGQNGWGGSSFFGGGVVVTQTYRSLDGAGSGAAPTNSVLLRLSGMGSFNELDMVDRANSQIYAANNTPAMLKIQQMTTKQTLNNDTGTATGNINANLADSIFASGGVNMAWYAITGTSI